MRSTEPDASSKLVSQGYCILKGSKFSSVTFQPVCVGGGGGRSSSSIIDHWLTETGKRQETLLQDLMQPASNALTLLCMCVSELITHSDSHINSLNECHIWMHASVHTNTHRFLSLLHPKSLSSQAQKKTGRIQRKVDRLKREYINMTMFCIACHTRCWIKHTNTHCPLEEPPNDWRSRHKHDDFPSFHSILHHSFYLPFSHLSHLSLCETAIDLFTKMHLY